MGFITVHGRTRTQRGEPVNLEVQTGVIEYKPGLQSQTGAIESSRDYRVQNRVIEYKPGL